MLPWKLSRTARYTSHSSSLKIQIIRDFTDSDSNNSTEDDLCVPQDQSKRGRPRAEKISILMSKGAISSSSIRCNICKRVFPREKSLQAHMRTHTGERPYPCDYPGCVKAFCQSGQLKTHQRLHTGEKPFMCSVEGCNSRFTHANRHCQAHPYATLKRIDSDIIFTETLKRNENNHIVREWLLRQQLSRQQRIQMKTKKQKNVNNMEAQNSEKKMSDHKTNIEELEHSNSNSSWPSQKEAEPVYEERDKWISALALLEMANGAAS